MTTPPFAGSSALLIEDEALFRRQLAGYLEQLGFDVTSCENLQKARAQASQLQFDFVLIDLNLPDGRGTTLLQEKIFQETTGVVMMTAEGGVTAVIEAMRQGADDFLVKPFEFPQLQLAFRRITEARNQARIKEFKKEQRAEGAALFFGPSLNLLRGMLEKIVKADERLQTELPPVLIQGETGTGKTAIARWIHHQGPRARQAFVEINCSALSESIAESELFGHEKGAFTDARTARIGLFEAAHGGTLFLDEISCMSLNLQAKLLKALEDRRIRRLGGTKEIPIDVRIIAAGNEDLRAKAASGGFREDLFHRLDLFRLHIPPLRERRDDLVELAEFLMKNTCKRHRLPLRKFTEEGKRKLLMHRWPGNIRELGHELERALIFEEQVEINFDHLNVSATPANPSGVEAVSWLDPNFKIPDSGFSLEEAISQLIARALVQSQQNVSGAARLLGVSRDYVRYRLSSKQSEPLGTETHGVGERSQNQNEPPG